MITLLSAEGVAVVGWTFVLLPSPFLGPRVWEPVGDLLAAAGQRVVIPPAGGPAPESPDDVLAAFLDVVPDRDDVVLVPHSNAGLYVPAIVTTRPVAACVFVDAVLPVASGEQRVAPPALVDTVRELADDTGVLPPWTSWWDADDVAPLFPDDEVRRAVEREQRPIPLRYLEATIRVPAGWDAVPGAYLAFGDTYADERADAQARGWPVETLAGRHLHMLTAAADIAAAVQRLARAAVD